MPSASRTQSRVRLKHVLIVVVSAILFGVGAALYFRVHPPSVSQSENGVFEVAGLVSSMHLALRDGHFIYRYESDGGSPSRPITGEYLREHDTLTMRVDGAEFARWTLLQTRNGSVVAVSASGVMLERSSRSVRDVFPSMTIPKDSK